MFWMVLFSVVSFIFLVIGSVGEMITYKKEKPNKRWHDIARFALAFSSLPILMWTGYAVARCIGY